MRAEIQKNVRFNFTVGILDGAFFGIGMGFASYITIIPLFVSTLTNSSALIGLIAAMHTIGWQLPQLLTSDRVARLRRYKPMVMLMTLNERVPFLALALIAALIPTLGRELALILTLLVVTWQSMGGGLTGTAWQSMIAKIIPPSLRGTFYGAQSSAANLFTSGGAIVAGIILSASGSGAQGFALCFFVAGVLMLFSYMFLGMTREPETAAVQVGSRSAREFWGALRDILRRDHVFRIFLGVRLLSQLATIGAFFFTVYAVRRFNMDAGTAGLMTGLVALVQTVANPLFGYLGDRYSHRLMFGLGVFLAGVGAFIALAAPQVEWFYLVFALSGFANAALWTTIMAITVEFGKEEERPYYIGLANTLTAPATVVAPIFGGWLADAVSYQAMFGVAAVAALVTAGIVYFMPEPRQHHEQALAPTPYAEQPLGMDVTAETVAVAENDQVNVAV